MFVSPYSTLVQLFGTDNKVAAFVLMTPYYSMQKKKWFRFPTIRDSFEKYKNLRRKKRHRKVGYLFHIAQCLEKSTVLCKR